MYMNKKGIFSVVAIATLLLIVNFALGAGAPVGGDTSQTIDLKDLNPLGSCSQVDCVLGKIIGAIKLISIPIVSIMVLVGAFQIVSAGGNAEQVKKGGKTILYAAVGFAVILLADGVVGVVQSIVNQ